MIVILLVLGTSVALNIILSLSLYGERQDNEILRGFVKDPPPPVRFTVQHTWKSPAESIRNRSNDRKN